jgi:pyrimidine-nucleoside phosphorylase
MNIVDIINKKRNNKELSYDELSFAINSYLNEEIPDYQMSALLMAICINDMTEQEIFNLTNIFIKSGDIIDFSSIPGVFVDKHSTGGVGDKLTLILAPLVASCGVNVVKMSGRGLGHTGGTIDKLESIPGFKVELDDEELMTQLKELKVAILSQSHNLVPADKKIYALRDVSGTVESVPLIASSIMSKKIASGADKIVIDLKVGKGALIKEIMSARRLANVMIKIGKHFKKEVVCILTNMDFPLGITIGNSLEVVESIQFLKGKRTSDVEKLVLEIGSHMVSMGKNIAYKEAYELVSYKLSSGEAYQKFIELIHYQGGNLKDMKISDKSEVIYSEQEGYITAIDALKLGNIAKHLGAGRESKEDIINYGVGIVLHKQINDYVKKGEGLLTLYYDDYIPDTEDVLSSYTFERQVCDQKIILEIIK